MKRYTQSLDNVGVMRNVRMRYFRFRLIARIILLIFYYSLNSRFSPCGQFNIKRISGWPYLRFLKWYANLIMNYTFDFGCVPKLEEKEKKIRSIWCVCCEFNLNREVVTSPMELFSYFIPSKCFLFFQQLILSDRYEAQTK